MRWSLTVSPLTSKEIKKETIYLFLIALFPVTLYAPVLLNSNGFVWDDPWMLVNNPFVKTLTAENLKSIFSSPYMGQYSPVNTIYYAIMYKFFGLNPFSFHLANILIHMANSFLLFVFIKELLEQKSGEKDESRITDIAFVCALLFSITTVQVEVVAWVSASKILLYSFFFLLSLIAYLRYQRTGRIKHFIFSHVFYILSIGSKEQAVILPLSLLLIDYFTQDKLVIRKQLNKVFFFAIAIGAGLLSLKIQEAGFGVKFTNDYFPLWQRMLLSFYSVCQYIVKILLPLKVGTFYGFPMKPGEPVPPVFLFYVLVGIFIIYYLVVNRKNKILIWGTLFFLVNLALSLHILPLGRETLMADRYCYISNIGVFLVCSHFFFILLNRFRKKQKLIMCIALLYITLIFIKSFVYVQSWTLLG